MTDETYELTPADGGQRQPAANTLAELIVLMRDGSFNESTRERLQEFATKLEARGVDSGKKVKGEIALKIAVEFDPDREFAVLTPTITFKLPTEKEGQTVAWFTSDGRLIEALYDFGKLALSLYRTGDLVMVPSVESVARALPRL